jgi:outer membrane protein assembly factor BamA
VLAYPVAWRLPETGYGFGLAGSLSFYTKSSSNSTSPSTIQLGIGYTQKHQLQLYIPFDFFWCNRKHALQGEVGYYDYNYNFYGVYQEPPQQPTRFDLTMALARAQYLHRVKKQIYVGARWWFERYLPSGIPTEVLGHNGSTNSTPGLLFLYDSRDHVQAARKGNFVELSANYQSKFTGSTFEFGRLRLDARKFFLLKEKSVIACQLFAEQITGTAPFNQLSNVGDAKRGRGFYPGYYRNESVFLMNLEWRYNFRPRVIAAAFVHTNALGKDLGHAIQSQWHPAAGAGIRFVMSKEMRVHLRLDGAYSAAGFNWYLSLGEAF